jgi:hypothetical protein
VITKPQEHEIDRAGKRLLREALESLGWVVTDVQEDYGIDSTVQVFEGKSPTGAWFYLQLKSSSVSDYVADGAFVSQELSIDHARYYALEMREPVFLIHADVASKKVYWCAPQLDRQLATGLANSVAKVVTVRIPIRQRLPQTAPHLLTSLEKIYLALAIRTFESASTATFAESLTHLPDQEELYQSFQEKGHTLRLRKIAELYKEKKFDQARPRAEALLADPDSTIEIKFWAQIQIEALDFVETVHSGKPQDELPRAQLAHAKSLQKLTSSGPNYLKFYSLVARRAAELEILAYENFSLYLAEQQHIRLYGNPMMALGLYARRAVVTSRIVSEYKRCVRLARYAANYPDRWALGRALTTIVRAIGRYLVTLRSENKLEAEQSFATSALQISKLAAWISEETGDAEGVVLGILSALFITDSVDSDAYRWASQAAQSLVEPELRADACARIERAKKRWKGEAVEGDYQGDAVWQVIQNMATALGIDVSKENDPLVRGLRIAAKDDSPERVLARCEHLLVSQGATGPAARRIQQLFNIGTAGSKVVHCTLHDFHVEGKELDKAYDEFKQKHCDSCPDLKPRPEGWRYTDDVRRTIQARNFEFVVRLTGTRCGLRYTDED